MCRSHGNGRNSLRADLMEMLRNRYVAPERLRRRAAKTFSGGATDNDVDAHIPVNSNKMHQNVILEYQNTQNFMLDLNLKSKW